MADEKAVLDLGEFVLASGAVGTAAMGIAEGFKSFLFKPIGFNRLKEDLDWAKSSLESAYGSDYLTLLESLYRLGRGKGDLPRIIRQGVRIGMNEVTAVKMARVVGDCTEEKLSNVAKKVANGEPLSPEDKNILGRFETAADARIDGALSLAERAYANGIRIRASIVALLLSFSAMTLLVEGNINQKHFAAALIVGLVAVPVAPIAKDIAKGLQSAAKAIRVDK